MDNKLFKQSWWELLAIQAGGTLCLPVIIVGQLLCQKYGWMAAALSIVTGNVLLLTIALAMAGLSTFQRKSTVEHAISRFGNRGSFLFGSIMIVSMLGWFAIQLNMMNLSLQGLLGLMGIFISPLVLTLIVGILISAAMCFGMKGMKTLSLISAPLLLVTMIYSIFSIKGSIAIAPMLTFSWISGLSIILGANIGAIIDLPTFFQHARSKKDGFICIILLYGLIVPLIELSGVYLTAYSPHGSILEILQTGHGFFWIVWTSVFVFLSGWTTNNSNLYSAIVSSYSLLKTLGHVGRTFLFGGIATLLACFNPLGHMEVTLEALGVTIGSMGAVILSSYLIERIKGNSQAISWISILSWGVGVSVGILSFMLNGLITPVPCLDAFFTAGLTQIILKWRKQNEKTYA